MGSPSCCSVLLNCEGFQSLPFHLPLSLSLFLCLSHWGTFCFSPHCKNLGTCIKCVPHASGLSHCWHALVDCKVLTCISKWKVVPALPYPYVWRQSNICNTNKVNPIVFALCQRMTCIAIHIWTGAYILNSLLRLILCFLFLGDNISGCCYHQRYQNREICKTSQSEYSIII